MKNKEILDQIAICCSEIRAFQGSNRFSEVENFADAIKSLNALIEIYCYFKPRNEALQRINEHLFG